MEDGDTEDMAMDMVEAGLVRGIIARHTEDLTTAAIMDHTTMLMHTIVMDTVTTTNTTGARMVMAEGPIEGRASRIPHLTTLPAGRGTTTFTITSVE